MARKSCHRYTAVRAAHHQSYYPEHPEENERGSCMHYWDNQGKKISDMCDRK